MQPRAYEPKTRKQTLETSESKQPKSQGNIGLEEPLFKLQGFLLLANTRNHCYANAALQCLHWISSDLRPNFQDAVTVGKLVHITPEHNTLSSLTIGWHFDGGQHDTSEFLLRVFQNISTTFGSWELPFQSSMKKGRPRFILIPRLSIPLRRCSSNGQATPQCAPC